MFINFCSILFHILLNSRCIYVNWYTHSQCNPESRSSIVAVHSPPVTGVSCPWNLFAFCTDILHICLKWGSQSPGSGCPNHLDPALTWSLIIPWVNCHKNHHESQFFKLFKMLHGYSNGAWPDFKSIQLDHTLKSFKLKLNQ